MNKPPEITYRVQAVRKDGLSFITCALAAAAVPEFVLEFDRLNGTNIALRGAPLDVAIDQATGRQEAEIKLFFQFVWDTIFLRVPLAEGVTPPETPDNPPS